MFPLSDNSYSDKFYNIIDIGKYNNDIQLQEFMEISKNELGQEYLDILKTKINESYDSLDIKKNDPLPIFNHLSNLSYDQMIHLLKYVFNGLVFKKIKINYTNNLSTYNMSYKNLNIILTYFRKYIFIEDNVILFGYNYVNKTFGLDKKYDFKTGEWINATDDDVKKFRKNRENFINKYCDNKYNSLGFYLIIDSEKPLHDYKNNVYLKYCDYYRSLSINKIKTNKQTGKDVRCNSTGRQIYTYTINELIIFLQDIIYYKLCKLVDISPNNTIDFNYPINKNTDNKDFLLNYITVLEGQLQLSNFDNQNNKNELSNLKIILRDTNELLRNKVNKLKIIKLIRTNMENMILSDNINFIIFGDNICGTSGATRKKKYLIGQRVYTKHKNKFTYTFFNAFGNKSLDIIFSNIKNNNGTNGYELQQIIPKPNSYEIKQKENYTEKIIEAFNSIIKESGKDFISVTVQPTIYTLEFLKQINFKKTKKQESSTGKHVLYYIV